ncbi:DegV family protein [Halalkalibacter akibai]|uniref:DegV family protein n=1 Tax=Halalkalibacter akibai (strain ATCC 43226 / DSM 21942 / CIP 109018 / JCM 9157 / 1139) TaxID=1236973 RepID=W4QMZ6_HALA3|nr:DegV family protein [Halalkalibacter akibai]GAE33023.1 DegV family protein [Halalkalibacter akibai JCM 9157]
MNRKVAIVTDSTAYISESVRNQHSIKMVPLNVIFGETSYQEELDITTDEFYEKMKSADELPKTSQPAIGQFVTLFEQLADEGYEQVVTIHLSMKISGTFQSAISAGEMVDRIDVFGFDTEISCAPQAYYVLEAAKLAEAGADAKEIIEKLTYMKKTSRAYFMVDDLNHLHRGGRLSGAQLVVGNLLKIKPILHFEEGSIVPFEKVRTEKKALARIVDLLAEDVSKGGSFYATVIHAHRLDGAEALAATIQERFPDVKVDISFFGPVIGTHLGAGSLGLSWQKQYT